MINNPEVLDPKKDDQDQTTSKNTTKTTESVKEDKGHYNYSIVMQNELAETTMHGQLYTR